MPGARNPLSVAPRRPAASGPGRASLHRLRALRADLPGRRNQPAGECIMSTTEIHISSALVHVRPERTKELAAQIAALEGADLHFAESGKIIVTLEAATSGAIADRLATIGRLAGVLAATLVYHEVTTAEALGEPLCS
jgi:periplasmic nitrate reductase NapD